MLTDSLLFWDLLRVTIDVKRLLYYLPTKHLVQSPDRIYILPELDKAQIAPSTKPSSFTSRLATKNR